MVYNVRSNNFNFNDLAGLVKLESASAETANNNLADLLCLRRLRFQLL
jgi:hypothetical protein